MTDGPDTQPDGGVLEERDDGGFALDVDLPKDGLFTLEEYLEMYDVASSKPAFAVLNALNEDGRLSASELSTMIGREGNDLHYYLRKLKRTALIRNRRNPNTGTEEPYSYYVLTDLGYVVLTEGLKTGIEKLAAEEATISAKYDES